MPPILLLVLWAPTLTASPQCSLDTPTTPDRPPDAPKPPRSPRCPLTSPICLLAPECLHSLPAPMHLWHPYTPDGPLNTPDTPNTPWKLPLPPDATYIPAGPWAPILPASPQWTPYTPILPDRPLTPPRSPQCPLTSPICLLAPECLHSLPAPMHLWHPYTPDGPLNTLTPLHPLGAPNAPWCYLYPCWPWAPTLLPVPQCTPDMPYTPERPPDAPALPSFELSLLCNWPSLCIHPVYNIASFFQLSLLCNWLSSWLCPVYNIPFWGTFSVLWSSANFCNISQTYTLKLQLLHNTKRPTKWSGYVKMIDPPWRTSTYKRPFTQEGNYLVLFISLTSISGVKLINSWVP